MALDGNCSELCLGWEIYDCASDFVLGNDDDPSVPILYPVASSNNVVTGGDYFAFEFAIIQPCFIANDDVRL